MRTIAVVAVHGVADQKPSESARQIANLLTDLSPPGRYSTFVEERIRIPVEPIRLSATAGTVGRTIPSPPARPTSSRSTAGVARRCASASARTPTTGTSRGPTSPTSWIA